MTNRLKIAGLDEADESLIDIDYQMNQKTVKMISIYESTWILNANFISKSPPQVVGKFYKT